MRPRDLVPRSPVLIATIGLVAWSLLVGAIVGSRILGGAELVAGEIRGSSFESDGVLVAVRDGDRPTLAGVVEVTIIPGMAADEIARELEQLGVIADAMTFSTLLTYTGIEVELQAGRYDLPRGASASEVIRRLRSGQTHDAQVTITEGLRSEEVGALLEADEIATAAEWMLAVNGPRPEPFLAGRPEGASLIGYLMPATYPLRLSTTADELVQAMLDAFRERVTDELIAEAEAQGLSLHEVVTLASIVEREGVLPEELPLIASALHNRLDAGVALEVDATIQFAIADGPSVARFGWWKLELALDDLDVDSPYNTYLYPGLPPGPIASAGFAAILAVIRPATTDYFYFVAAPECDGSHRFAADLPEHNANVVAFRASGCGD